MARAEAALMDVPVEARSGLEEYVFQLIYSAAEKRRRQQAAAHAGTKATAEDTGSETAEYGSAAEGEGKALSTGPDSGKEATASEKVGENS